MTFQINHNLLHDVNNNITLQQWNELMEAVRNAPCTKRQPDDVLYICNTPSRNSTRFSCYDNYDRYDVPGLDFVISNDDETGRLTVYNGSEQARAPITFEQGKQIAEHFFNDHGSAFAEDIVCNWVMDGNPSTF
jgi:hypothetical protein